METYETTEKNGQLFLLPDKPPVPTYEGTLELSDLIDRLDVRWFDRRGKLILKVVSHAFVESVRKFGVLHPVILVLHENEQEPRAGEYRIAAGRGRVQAAIEAGLDSIPVRVYSSRDVSGPMITVIENAHRTENLVAEYEAVSQIIAESRAAGQPITERELCDALNLNVQALRKLMRLGGLDLRLLDALRDGQIAQSVAESAAKLPQAYQDTLVAVLEEKKTITGDDVRAARTVHTSATAAALPDLLFDTPPAPTAPTTDAALLRSGGNGLLHALIQFAKHQDGDSVCFCDTLDKNGNHQLYCSLATEAIAAWKTL